MTASIYSTCIIHIVHVRPKIVFHRAQYSSKEKSLLTLLGADLQIDLEILFMIQLKGFNEMPHLMQDSAYL